MRLERSSASGEGRLFGNNSPGSQGGVLQIWLALVSLDFIRPERFSPS